MNMNRVAAARAAARRTRVLEGRARPRIPAPRVRARYHMRSSLTLNRHIIRHIMKRTRTMYARICSNRLEIGHHAPDGYAAASSLEERGAGGAGVLDRLNKRLSEPNATRTVHTSLIISHSVFSPCLGPTPRRHRRGHSLRQSRRKIIFEYALRTGCGSDVQVSRHKCRARYGLAAGSTTCEALSACTQGASPSSFPAVVWVPTLL